MAQRSQRTSNVCACPRTKLISRSFRIGFRLILGLLLRLSAPAGGRQPPRDGLSCYSIHRLSCYSIHQFATSEQCPQPVCLPLLLLASCFLDLVLDWVLPFMPSFCTFLRLLFTDAPTCAAHTPKLSIVTASLESSETASPRSSSLRVSRSSRVCSPTRLAHETSGTSSSALDRSVAASAATNLLPPAPYLFSRPPTHINLCSCFRSLLSCLCVLTATQTNISV